MTTELSRTEVDALPGLTVLVFGASWCSVCKATEPLLDQAFARHTGVTRLWIEDGKGKRLGRSFRVKLWPSLIFLRDGREVARLVRPDSEEELEEAFVQLSQ